MQAKVRHPMVHPRPDPRLRQAFASSELAQSSIVPLGKALQRGSKLIKVSVKNADGVLLNTFEVTTINEARELIAVMECPKLNVGDTICLDEIDE